MHSSFFSPVPFTIFGRGSMFFGEKAKVNELETLLAEEQNKTAALEQEREQAKVVEEKTAGIEKKPEVKELLEAMTETPLLYHEVLAYFHRFKKESKEFAEATDE